MRRKLTCVLLIDDEKADNFYHKVILEENEVAEKVISFQKPLEALEYLHSPDSDAQPKPELIFLDINMPRMNGWEFLEAYSKFKIPEKHRPVIVMLSTTFNPEDKERASSCPDLHEFRTKPLTDIMLTEIQRTYFSDKVGAREEDKRVEKRE